MRCASIVVSVILAALASPLAAQTRLRVMPPRGRDVRRRPALRSARRGHRHRSAPRPAWSSRSTAATSPRPTCSPRARRRARATAAPARRRETAGRPAAPAGATTTNFLARDLRFTQHRPPRRDGAHRRRRRCRGGLRGRRLAGGPARRTAGQEHHHARRRRHGHRAPHGGAHRLARPDPTARPTRRWRWTPSASPAW